MPGRGGGARWVPLGGTKWFLGSTWWAREPLLPAEWEIDATGTGLARCAYVYPDLMSKLV